MLEERLHELETEYERGQEQMAFLDQKRAELRDTLLRISGAIQVLKELVEQNGKTSLANTADRNEELASQNRWERQPETFAVNGRSATGGEAGP